MSSGAVIHKLTPRGCAAPPPSLMNKCETDISYASRASTSTIDQGSKVILGNSSQENKILTDCCNGGREKYGLATEVREIHQAGGLRVGFLDPFDDARGVGRVFELDGDGAVDVQFLDGPKVRLEFHDPAAGGQVAVDFAVAIADVDMDGFAFELSQIGRASVRQDKVTDVDVGPHAQMGALVHKTCHRVNAVEQAQTERLELECDVDVLFVGVIAKDAAGLDSPVPLLGRRDDFALPDVFAQDEEDVFRTPISGEVDEGFTTLYMEVAHRIVEVDEAGCDNGERDDGQAAFLAGVQHEAFFLPRDGHGFCE